MFECGTNQRSPQPAAAKRRINLGVYKGNDVAAASVSVLGEASLDTIDRHHEAAFCRVVSYCDHLTRIDVTGKETGDREGRCREGRVWLVLGQSEAPWIYRCHHVDGLTCAT